jgi:hypothetical protein
MDGTAQIILAQDVTQSAVEAPETGHLAAIPPLRLAGSRPEWCLQVSGVKAIFIHAMRLRFDPSPP